MSLRPWFEWVNEFPSAVAIRESLNYPYLLTFHAIVILLFVGLVLMMDLRLAAWGFRQTPVSQMQKRLFPWQLLTMVLSTITGLVLLWGQPLRYYGKPFFWIKMALMLLAGLNALVFHQTTYRTAAVWDASYEPPAGVKAAGVISIVVWAGVIVFGRITAYNWWDLG